MERIAIYPGSFDPVTNGHLDILERGLKLFDKIIVAILHNPGKAGLFSIEERRELLRTCTRKFPNVEVDTFDVKAMEKALKECTQDDGTAVIIAKGPCIFVSRNPQPAYSVDADMCVACGTCAKAGCPATTKIDEINPKTEKKKAGIDPVLCIGCDICRQICPTGAIQKPES